MGDVKNVRVDNWGIFFLQRLQTFFNKTDYCDLTLQFQDNTQLKVHRLVLNTCTDYFTILEQNCEMIEDCLIMPMDLQADVVVPIINFMYTGQLEFKYSLYERLHTTAQIMSLTVLTKLLDAQKVPPSSSQPVLLNRRNPIIPVSYNLQGVKRVSKEPDMTSSIRKAAPTWKRRYISQHYEGSNMFPEPVALISNRGNISKSIDNSPRPTRFEGLDDDTDSIFETSFDNISYESKPLTLGLIKSEPQSPKIGQERNTSANSFEELRRGYVSKRTAPTSYSQPEPKRVNLQEVKEYVEAHKMRTNYELEEEQEDDPENDHDETMYDSIQNDDDDDADQEEELILKQSPKSTRGKSLIKVSNKDTLKSGDTSKNTYGKAENVNHAQIISDVLKKYPHLVKHHKNLKVKVMQTTPKAPSLVTKEPAKKVVIGLGKDNMPIQYSGSSSQLRTEKQVVKDSKTEPVTKAIDVKTMHALIAKGAENVTGPWFCTRCGTTTRPINFPTYAVFRKHLVNVHKERIDSRICEYCGHKSTKRNYLLFHLYTKHDIPPPNNIEFPKCNQCNYVALTEALLIKHKLNHSRLNEFVCNHCSTWFNTKSALLTHIQQTGHKIAPIKKDSQQCVYCNKLFMREANMYAHIKTMHKEQARADGIIELSDDEEQQYKEADEIDNVDETYIPNNPQIEHHDGKIKVISDIPISPSSASFILKSSQTVSKITGRLQLDKSGKVQSAKSLPITSTSEILRNATVQSLEPSSEAEALSNVATGIATSLGLVDSIVVMEEHQYEIPVQEMDIQTDNEQYIVSEMQTIEDMQIDEIPDGNIITTATNEIVTHSESMPLVNPISTTQIITQGNDLKLTESQQNEIISELQNSNQLPSGNNVVMVLTEDQYKKVKDSDQLNQDDNIYVVFSQASAVDPTDKQYLQLGESEDVIEDTLETSQLVEDPEEMETELQEQVVVQSESDQNWPEETVDQISQELQRQLSDEAFKPVENVSGVESEQSEPDYSTVQSSSDIVKIKQITENVTDVSLLIKDGLEVTATTSGNTGVDICQENADIAVEDDSEKLVEAPEETLSEIVNKDTMDESNVTSNTDEFIEEELSVENMEVINDVSTETDFPKPDESPDCENENQQIDNHVNSENVSNIVGDWPDEMSDSEKKIVHQEEESTETIEESIENIERELHQSDPAKEHDHEEFGDKTDTLLSESDNVVGTGFKATPRSYSRSQSSEKTTSNADVKTKPAEEKITKLLDDWNDNDSQPEEPVVPTAKEIPRKSPLNKLMDDWEEEENGE